MLQRRIGARDYTLVPHRAIGHLAEQIYALTRLAFGSYAGVLVPSPEHRDWYVRRPGMDADLSVAVLCEGRLVSNVFVTVAAVRLGGGLLPAGIVDTVMTHPAHRRQGLARWALETAIAGMRDRGLAASLLYTVAGSMPAALYGSLGYRAQAPVRYYRALPGAHGRPAGGEHARRLDPGEYEAARQFIDACLARCDGSVPLDEALWRWRRLDRPTTLPAELWGVAGPGGWAGCAALCRAPIVTADGGQELCGVFTDLALAPGADLPRVLGALLAAVPDGAEARALAAEADASLCAACEGLGLAVAATETAMVLPLNAVAQAALAGPQRPWAPLAESIIGV